MKSIPLAELERLKKFMALTFSTTDAEALSAMRMANKVLERHKLSWADVFGRTVSVDTVEATQGDDDPSEAALKGKITRSFDYLHGRDLGNFAKFIDSLEAQWEAKGYLSIKQRQVLFETVNIQEMK